MTLRHMRIFVSVYRHSNITKAAAELHLAQPSVSLSVKELEEYYGIRLFERIGRRIYPTQSGSEFYGYALHIVSLFEEMEQKVKNWDALGTLRIGASISIGTYILPGLISRFQSMFPEMRIQAMVNKSSTIERHILDNSIDIGLIENQSERGELTAIPFMDDFMCAVVSNDHPLKDHENVNLKQLAQYPFLMREEGSAGRERLNLIFDLLQLSVTPLWESSSTQAIVQAVAGGLGVAVLPFLLVKKDIEEGVVTMIPFVHPLRRSLNIIYHKSKYLTKSMDSFIGLCKELKQEASYE